MGNGSLLMVLGSSNHKSSLILAMQVRADGRFKTRSSGRQQLPTPVGKSNSDIFKIQIFFNSSVKLPAESFCIFQKITGSRTYEIFLLYQ